MAEAVIVWYGSSVVLPNGNLHLKLLSEDHLYKHIWRQIDKQGVHLQLCAF